MQKTRKDRKVTGSQDDDFVGGVNTTGWICRKHEKIEKSQALRMTILWGGEYNWLDMQKTRKIEKVTGSQDDDFVGGGIQLGAYRENTKRSKETQALRMAILSGA